MCLTFQGVKEKNIEDVHDFSFVLPTVEYHNCIWTWFDFFIVMKNVAKRVVLSQVMTAGCVLMNIRFLHHHEKCSQTGGFVSGNDDRLCAYEYSTASSL